MREVAARAGAQRVVLLVDEGDDAVPTMLEWAEGGTFELTEGGVTEQIDPAALAGVLPAVRPDVRPLPPTALSVDETGELAAPIGALAGIATAIVELAAAFGGRSVATAEFATREPACRSRSPRARASASSRRSARRPSPSRRVGPS